MSENARQMALVRKAGLGGRLGKRRSLLDQTAGEAKSLVADIGTRGQAGHRLEVADDLETGDARRCREMLQIETARDVSVYDLAVDVEALGGA
jgi:hypothetical protein